MDSRGGCRTATGGGGLHPAPAGERTRKSVRRAVAVPPPKIPETDDEDAAEARRAPDENFSTIQAQAPQLASVAAAPKPAPVAAIPPAVARAAAAPIPAIRPAARPDSGQDVNVASAMPSPAIHAPIRPAANDISAKPVTVAALPRMRPTLRAENGEGDQDQTAMATPGHNWTIQIGAYADQALAKAQLDAYAQKSMDVLGQAARLVVPFQASDGHTMYRARFGLFAEREAREVCGRLTQRGQTCFAAVAAR